MNKFSLKSSGVKLKTPEDIKRIADAGRVISELFEEISKTDLASASAFEIDTYIESFLNKHACRASFKTMQNYAYSSCISINHEAVHGIPHKKKKIKTGDIVKIDIGASKNGYFADACRTFACGRISTEAQRLIETAQIALAEGIEQARAGNFLGDIGYAVEKYVNSRKCSVVREFCGHGVGFAAHEPPVVLHYGKEKTGLKIAEGLVIAVEPIINEGKRELVTLSDGWTAVTKDGSLSAQFEETIAVTKNGVIVLTSLV
ncbi:MAG: type I methionyl aminopeptidase [Spirochaetes bacterium]|nr:type I methionyl aminopeptidase [Spirochaetota bacterium]